MTIELRRFHELHWRALLDSNQWPSASELAQSVSTTVTGLPQPPSNRTVSAEPRSQATTFLPTDREHFATRLLPRGRAPSLLTVREVAAQLRVCTATVYRLCAGAKRPKMDALEDLARNTGFGVGPGRHEPRGRLRAKYQVELLSYRSACAHQRQVQVHRRKSWMRHERRKLPRSRASISSMPVLEADDKRR